MRIHGTPFYPLTHDLEEVQDHLSEFFLYEDYAYLVDQALSLLARIRDEVLPETPVSPLQDLTGINRLTVKTEEQGLTLETTKQSDAELEKLLFAIHRNSHIRLLVEARGYAIHSAIRSQIGGIDHLADDILVYLFSAVKASQTLMELGNWMHDVEADLFERQGAGTLEGAGERLADTRENYREVYSTLINELRSENLRGEIDTAIQSSIFLSEANNSRLLASVYPSLDEARRQKESFQLLQESKREASAKGGKKLLRGHEWAFHFLADSLSHLAYDECGVKRSKRSLVILLIEEILPKELEKQLKRPNPKGAPTIPAEKTLSGNGAKKPGWLKQLGYDELPETKDARSS